jgi:hypothetical protein
MKLEYYRSANLDIIESKRFDLRYMKEDLSIDLRAINIKHGRYSFIGLVKNRDVNNYFLMYKSSDGYMYYSKDIIEGDSLYYIFDRMFEK